jgi:arginase
MQLAEGTEVLRQDLPASSTVQVPVPLGAGSDQGSGVNRLTAIQLVRNELADALESSRGVPIVIGGDCGVELASVQHAVKQQAVVGGRLAVVWFDAHADLNTPESSTSGAFHGMVLRTLLGDGLPALLPDRPLEPAQVVLAGVRTLDDAEVAYIDHAGIPLLPPDTVTPESLAAAIAATGATALYVHVDLDILDPAEFGSVHFPEPFGITASRLTGLITAARACLPLVGATITEFAPSSPDQASDDVPTVLRILGALTA